MKWQLDRKSLRNGQWHIVYEGPSVEACKNYARRNGRYGEYRIYAGDGEQLAYVCKGIYEPWERMIWHDGSRYPRSLMYLMDSAATPAATCTP